MFASALPTGTTLTVGGTGTFDLAGFAQTVAGLADGGVSTGTVTDSGAAATFTINDAAASSFSGTITNGANALALTKTAAGTLTLSGINTYSGTTTVSAGTLQVGNAGATGTLGSGNVVDNATMHFDRTDSGLIVTNVISGTGSVTQAGSGTTTLLGANTYTGVTTVSAGTLQVGNGGAAGTLGTGSVTDNAALVFDQSDAVTVNSGISGSGSLTQDGTGTTILTGANSYGTTLISAGTLQIGNDGVTGTLGAGAVVDNAVLSFLRTNTVTAANNISGSGSLVQVGGGTILTGTNTYGGATIIDAGSITASGGSALPATGSVTLANAAGTNLDLDSSQAIGSLAGGGTTGGNVAPAPTL